MHELTVRNHDYMYISTVMQKSSFHSLYICKYILELELELRYTYI